MRHTDFSAKDFRRYIDHNLLKTEAFRLIDLTVSPHSIGCPGQPYRASLYQLPNGLWKWCSADSGTAGCLINNVSIHPALNVKAVTYEAI